MTAPIRPEDLRIAREPSPYARARRQFGEQVEEARYRALVRRNEAKIREEWDRNLARREREGFKSPIEEPTPESVTTLARMRAVRSQERYRTIDKALFPRTADDLAEIAKGLPSIDPNRRGYERGGLGADMLVSLTLYPGIAQAVRDIATDIREGEVGPLTALSTLAAIPVIGPVLRLLKGGGKLNRFQRAAIEAAERGPDYVKNLQATSKEMAGPHKVLFDPNVDDRKFMEHLATLSGAWEGGNANLLTQELDNIARTVGAPAEEIRSTARALTRAEVEPVALELDRAVKAGELTPEVAQKQLMDFATGGIRPTLRSSTGRGPFAPGVPRLLDRPLTPEQLAMATDPRLFPDPAPKVSDQDWWRARLKETGERGFSDVRDAGAAYAQRAGLGEMPPVERVTEANQAAHRKVAEAYQAAKNAPDDPQVRAAYDAFAKETEAQYEYLVNDLGVEVIPSAKDPYPNSAAMIRDVVENNRLKVYSGESVHPLLTPEQNFKFRAIHDYFAHAGPGNQFGPVGEENAFREHARMFSPEARGALATETRGQNSWVNFGPESGRPVKERPFAEQKAFLLPEELRKPVYGIAPIAAATAASQDEESGLEGAALAGAALIPTRRQVADVSRRFGRLLNFGRGAGLNWPRRGEELGGLFKSRPFSHNLMGDLDPTISQEMWMGAGAGFGPTPSDPEARVIDAATRAVARGEGLAPAVAQSGIWTGAQMKAGAYPNAFLAEAGLPSAAPAVLVPRQIELAGGFDPWLAQPRGFRPNWAGQGDLFSRAREYTYQSIFPRARPF